MRANLRSAERGGEWMRWSGGEGDMAGFCRAGHIIFTTKKYEFTPAM